MMKRSLFLGSFFIERTPVFGLFFLLKREGNEYYQDFLFQISALENFNTLKKKKKAMSSFQL